MPRPRAGHRHAEGRTGAAGAPVRPRGACGPRPAPADRRGWTGRCGARSAGPGSSRCGCRRATAGSASDCRRRAGVRGGGARTAARPADRHPPRGRDRTGGGDGRDRRRGRRRRPRGVAGGGGRGARRPGRGRADALAGPADAAAPDPGRPAAAGPVAVVLTAAEQLGTATLVCEPTTQHARTREQFGRPVGAFQAVAHLCAGMLVRAGTARAAVCAAAVTADPVDIAAARLLADRAAVRSARDCLQVHGGMVFTWESEVHCTSSAPGSGPTVRAEPRRVRNGWRWICSPTAPERGSRQRSSPPPPREGPGDVTDRGIGGSRSVDTFLCPARDSSRPVAGRPLRYLVWDASGYEHAPHRSCPRGRAGSAGVCPCSPGGRARRRRLFDSPGRASHSMPHGYSFALEYARSACWGDCTSTMLCHKGFTVRDPCPGRCSGHAENGYDRGLREARA